MRDALGEYYFVEERLNEHGFSLKEEPKVRRVEGKAVLVEGYWRTCSYLDCDCEPQYVAHVWLTREVVARIYVCSWHLRDVKDLAHRGFRVGYVKFRGPEGE